MTPPPLRLYLLLRPTAVAATVLHFTAGSLATVLVGMYVVDLTDHHLTAATNAAAAQNTTTLNFSSTGSAPNNIVAGMTVKCISNPATVFPGTTVASVTGTTVTLTITLVIAVVAGDTFQFDNANQIIENATATAVNNTGASHDQQRRDEWRGQHWRTIQFLTSVPETRAYVYTFVSDFSEESLPSPATVASGDGTGTWVVIIPTPPADYADNAPFNPGHYRLYRTVTDSQGNATYYQVTEVPINPVGPVTIHDSARDALLLRTWY